MKKNVPIKTNNNKYYKNQVAENLFYSDSFFRKNNIK